MAEINLLKNPTSNHSPVQAISGIVVKLFAVLAVGIVVFYGYLILQVKSATKNIAQTEQDIITSKTAALAAPGREEFLSRQAQLKEFSNLVAAHAYYSKFLPAMAKVTLKSAYYSNITVGQQGKVTMNVVVPTLADLDKFLQVFNQPDINKDFQNVRLGGFSKTQDQSGLVYTFQVQMDFNPGILSR